MLRLWHDLTVEEVMAKASMVSNPYTVGEREAVGKPLKIRISCDEVSCSAVTMPFCI